MWAQHANSLGSGSALGCGVSSEPERQEAPKQLKLPEPLAEARPVCGALCPQSFPQAALQGHSSAWPELPLPGGDIRQQQSPGEALAPPMPGFIACDGQEDLGKGWQLVLMQWLHWRGLEGHFVEPGESRMDRQDRLASLVGILLGRARWAGCLSDSPQRKKWLFVQGTPECFRPHQKDTGRAVGATGILCRPFLLVLRSLIGKVSAQARI